MPSVSDVREIAGAIEARKEESKSGEASLTSLNQRQPSSLQGLLRFAMEATKAEDAPYESHALPMDEERRKFLEDALKSMTVDVIELLQKQIKILQKVDEVQSDEFVQESVAAFETIYDYVDNIDTANDFHKIGGFMILRPCLESNHARIRAGACELLAILCQNNPYCQRIIIDNQFVPQLIDILNNDTDPNVTVKCLYALNSIVRDNSEGFDQLIQYNGLTVFLKLLKGGNEKVIKKITFLLATLCRTVPDLKSRLIFLEYLPGLISLISEERKDTDEFVLSLLVTLVEENSTAILECKSSKYNLKDTLSKHISGIRNKEEFLEEEQYCKRLLHLLSSI